MADQSTAIKDGGFTCLEVLLRDEFNVISSKIIKEDTPMCLPVYWFLL